MYAVASTYRLVRWQDLDEKDRRVPPARAAVWLRTWLSDSHHRHEVHEALRSLGPSHRFSKGWLDDRDLDRFVRPRLARAIETGELVLVERVPNRGAMPMLQEPDSPKQVTGGEDKAAPTKTWIEFEVLDTEGEPLSGQRYEARLTDGSKKTGVTGETGLVRFDGIEPGICEFTLLDAEAQEVQTAEAPPKLEALDLELVDDEGKAVANTTCFVKLKNGPEKELKTNAEGRGRIEGLEAGDYEVRFPNLEVSR